MSETVKKFVIAGGIGVLAIIFFIFTKDNSGELTEDSELYAIVEEESVDIATANPSEIAPIVMVDVKGEVNHPGVYELENEARVDDVIRMAGGFTEDAALEQINLAQKVQDEMIIIVQERGEEGAVIESTGMSSTDGSGKVRVNYATQEEIETLSGIGPSKAQAIIQHREEHGLFKSPEDLMQVSGIGQKTFENIQDHVQIP